MKIKKLEIVGFKSFADRGRLIFGEGITGVVGPNGCGKSNIVDAIRWCMGEMSAKHLRGRAMQDVIFGGCTSRGPMGMAEVTLTFSNDGNVPPQYASFSELAVTRRLHRDGTSEYLINKVQVRLKDITDLFLGTGVGTRAYSIIEQGRIGFVVNSKPEERRSLIEEVAGITKFKARKKAAERRMEATEQNLLRVNDVVSELERQLGSLRRHAKKAVRYRELKTELRDLELHGAAVDWLRLQTEEKVLHETCATAAVGLEDAQRSMETDEAQLEVERIRLLEEERRLQLEQHTSAEIDARLAALERDLEHWRDKLVQTRHRTEDAASDVEESQERIASARRELESLCADISTLQGLVRESQTVLANHESGVVDLRSDVASIDDEIEVLRQEASSLLQTETHQRAVLSSLNNKRDDVLERLQQMETERSELTDRTGTIEARRRELEDKRVQVTTSLEAWKRELAEARQTHQATLQELQKSDKAIRAHRDVLSERRSRLQSLKQIAQRFEGYSDGVRALFRTSADGQRTEPVLAGIQGLVTDILRVPSDYERAIEAALGDKLQHIIVQAQETGKEALAYLREHGGRGGFIPVDLVAKPSSEDVPSDPSVRGLALNLVQFDEASKGIVETLLGDVLVVESLDAALALWQQRKPSQRLVTLAGEVVQPEGILEGGAEQGAGLLAQRREIRELTSTVAELQAELEVLNQEHEAIAERRRLLEQTISELDASIRKTELEHVELGKDLQSATVELKRMAERLAVVSSAIVNHSEQISRLDDDEMRAHDLADKAHARKQAVDEELSQLQERRQVQSNYLQTHVDQLTKLKVDLAANEQKLSAAMAANERLARAEREYQSRIERDSSAINEGEALIGDLATRIAEGEAHASELSLQAQARRESLSNARASYEADRAKMSSIEQRLKEGRRDTDDLQSRMMQAKIDLQRVEMETRRLIDHVLERHDADLLRVMCDYHLRRAPGEAERERKFELERSIKAMGTINLTAIEECAEVETRYNFLVVQRDDLNQALASLKKAISQINRASRERFKEAFDAVNEMFQKVFPRLFRGGEARLELVGTDDLLEAGVDIIAMPPGKKLQNVGLLSGGEKALTATALVFSIFLIKPSPFCILDEVDAPLDEANVGRFNEMLREIAHFSQFIVITHNKQTMCTTDRIYGITMEEPGMSKVVAVDLESKEETRAA